MAKRFFAALCFALSLAISTAAPAFADADRVVRLAGGIAAEAERRAEALRHNPAAPGVPFEIGDPLLTQLDEFALAALTLSRAIEAEGGPEDLKCIFRGMSRDAPARIAEVEAAATRADQSRAYAEIARLTRQAERIAAEPDAQVGTSFVSCGSE
jgi:hypothetical protein